MLSQLYIENIAVIRQATIDFQQGFHVFTGETGAGKTILISAINAVLGGRTFKEIIRTGETRATVSALFTEISEELCKKIEVLGYPLEGNQLLVQREIDLSGKGQCRLDGRPATAAMLREVCSLLIDIHGQHEHQSLLHKEYHRSVVDRFAGEEAQGLKQKIAGKYEEYRKILQKMEEKGTVVVCFGSLSFMKELYQIMGE